jgi:hypothetical protein
MKLIMQSPPASRHFLLGPNILLTTPSICVLPLVRQTKFHTRITYFTLMEGRKSKQKRPAGCWIQASPPPP